jgi:hypothetical protein
MDFPRTDPALVDEPGVARIDWGDEPDEEPA